MQVDETGRDHQAGRVDHPPAGERFGGNARDPVASDADVADCVEAGFGVHDTAAGQYDVVGLGSYRRGCDQPQQQQQ
jgi:hypothetical protein